MKADKIINNRVLHVHMSNWQLNQVIFREGEFRDFFCEIYFLQNVIPNEVGVSHSNVYLQPVLKTDHDCQRIHLYQITMGYVHHISTNNKVKMHVHVRYKPCFR